MNYQEKHGTGERLQKFLARAGIASRRQAEQLILAGRVTVNGEKVLTLGTRVGSGDTVKVDGREIHQQGEPLHYYLLYKPAGVITSAKDPRGRKTVLDLLKNVPVRIFPVGRLDYDTSGLLVLTNDGELAHRLMHPRYGVEKTYRVWVKGPVSREALSTLRQGVLLEDGLTSPARVQVIKPAQKVGRLEEVEIIIHEGRKRQVRRMFAAVGFPVLKLERVRFGPLQLDNKLRPGDFRALSLDEVKALRLAVGLPIN